MGPASLEGSGTSISVVTQMLWLGHAIVASVAA